MKGQNLRTCPAVNIFLNMDISRELQESEACPGNAHPLNRWGKYHVRLTSCTYSLRLGCFEKRENVLQAELQLIPNQ